MFFRLLFAEHMAGLPLLQFDVVVLTALALFITTQFGMCPIVFVTVTFRN
jgi:hypothetical protein